jgi:hypothetical protein
MHVAIFGLKRAWGLESITVTVTGMVMVTVTVMVTVMGTVTVMVTVMVTFMVTVMVTVPLFLFHQYMKVGSLYFNSLELLYI